MKDHDHKNLWYTRRGSVIEGPYPAGQVARYLLLGRLRKTDEVSQDGQTWHNIMDCPEVVPPLMLEDSPEAEERLLLARIHEDERGPGDRRDHEEEVPQHIRDRRRHRDRRRPEDFLTEEQRELRYQRWKAMNRVERPHYLKTALAGLLFLVLVVSVVILFGERREFPNPDCDAAPQPRVNWYSCQIEGVAAAGKDMTGAYLYNAVLTAGNFAGAILRQADLSYTRLGLANFGGADLREAKLYGAYLERADLEGADLRNADLSYAILRHANLKNARLAGARLDKAVWIDGRTCLPGSVGACLVAK